MTLPLSVVLGLATVYCYTLIFEPLPEDVSWWRLAPWIPLWFGPWALAKAAGRRIARILSFRNEFGTFDALSLRIPEWSIVAVYALTVFFGGLPTLASKTATGSLLAELLILLGPLVVMEVSPAGATKADEVRRSGGSAWPDWGGSDQTVLDTEIRSGPAIRCAIRATDASR